MLEEASRMNTMSTYAGFAHTGATEGNDTPGPEDGRNVGLVVGADVDGLTDGARVEGESVVGVVGACDRVGLPVGLTVVGIDVVGEDGELEGSGVVGIVGDVGAADTVGLELGSSVVGPDVVGVVGLEVGC
jgi:hypothetical protein